MRSEGSLPLAVGIVLIAVNLRPALATVGPLVDPIRAATGLSSAAIGLLTTLPLLAFSLVSAFTARVTRHTGVARALGLALGLLVVGAAMRIVPGAAALFGGTALLGCGIALGNVLLPVLVRRDFPERTGLLTSLYSSGIGLGAAVAAGLSVPLAAALGWRTTLAAWAAPAAVALVAWVPQLRRRAGGPTAPPPARSPYRSRLAWAIALFFGLHSLAFYVFLAWLPDLLQARGYDAAAAGNLLALTQLVGVAGSALVPLWAGRRRDQRAFVLALGAAEATALVGLLAGGASATLAWVVLLGFALGGAFSLSLLLISVRAASAPAAAALSGMAQAVGYAIAAVGPAAFGALYDLTGAYAVPLAAMLLVLVAKVAAGLPAARADARVDC